MGSIIDTHELNIEARTEKLQEVLDFVDDILSGA